jgi:hypothetical protein
VSGKIIWKDEPDQRDYPAADSHLSLRASPQAATVVADKLRRAELTHAKAQVILRASGLRLFDTINPHVASDLRKVDQGHKPSPVLLVRDLAWGVPCRTPSGTAGSAPVITWMKHRHSPPPGGCGRRLQRVVTTPAKPISESAGTRRGT